MKNKDILKKIEDVFIYEDYLDEKFPKGDERRGEVLTLIAILNSKIRKIFQEELNEQNKKISSK